jgi:IS1 family transposase
MTLLLGGCCVLPGLLCVLGARDIATGQQLWEAVKSDLLHAVMSDY